MISENTMANNIQILKNITRTQLGLINAFFSQELFPVILVGGGSKNHELVILH